jgi:hypothetical protein
MRITKTNESFTGRINNQEYSDILFEELVVKKANIIKTKFQNIHFKNCYIGFDSNYIDCTFDTCKFFGKYSSLGSCHGMTKYDSCNFVNCNFTGLDILNGTNFIKCKFTGLFKNIILIDAQGKLKSMGTQFFNCDLEGLRFDNISIYGKNLFVNTILPKSGLRFYMNINDSLVKRAKDICSKIDADFKIESEVIFNESIRSGQNPIILDDLFINSFFKTDDSRKLFNDIVKDCEIKTTSS